VDRDLAQLHPRRESERPTVKAWLMLVAGVVALTLSAARCDREVDIGVDPNSDAAAAHADAAAGAGG